jgi:hypothetical protein
MGGRGEEERRSRGMRRDDQRQHDQLGKGCMRNDSERERRWTT